MENYPKKDVLMKMTFKKSFFGSIDNVKRLFGEMYGIIEYKESKNIITGIIRKLKRNPDGKEKIIKHLEPVKYNDFVVFRHIDIEWIPKKKKTTENVV